jgi:membrane protease YdiL (CAAX protease family)
MMISLPDQSMTVIDNDRRECFRFIAVTFAITWGIGGLYAFVPSMMEKLFGEVSTTALLYFVAVYAPSIAAIILTFCSSRMSGVARLIGSLRPRLANWPYYLAVLLGWPVLDSIALSIQRTIGGDDVVFLDPSRWYLAPGILLFTLISDAGPMGEELGWRAYLLPRMLRGRWSPLVVAIVLGIVWGIWHLPAFFLSGTAQHDAQMGIIWLLLGTILTSIIMTWLFRRTGGDVLASGLLVHLMNNLTQASLLYLDLAYLPIAIIAGIALARDRQDPADGCA